MRKANHDMQVEAPSARMFAATASFRRQLRIRNITLIIVGIEAIVFVALHTWNAF